MSSWASRSIVKPSKLSAEIVLGSTCAFASKSLRRVWQGIGGIVYRAYHGVGGDDVLAGKGQHSDRGRDGDVCSQGPRSCETLVGSSKSQKVVSDESGESLGGGRWLAKRGFP